MDGTAAFDRLVCPSPRLSRKSNASQTDYRDTHPPSSLDSVSAERFVMFYITIG